MHSSFYKTKLKNVLSAKRGASLSGKYYATRGNKIRLTLGNFNYPNGGFKHNTSKDNIFFIGNVKDEFILKKGDIITPLTEQVAGLLGETARIPEDNTYIQSGDIALIIPKENKLDASFAYYLVSSKSIKLQLGAAAQQTKIRHTSPEKIENCEAWIPEDILVQKNIGVFLDLLNQKIELNNKIKIELEQIAKDLYKYWFVQFDFPDKDKRPYKSSGGKMVYNEILKREIPEGWTVESIADNQLSKILKPGIKQFDGQKIYLPTATIENDRIIDKSNLITYDNREGRANMEPVNNSVWFAKMKNTKKVLYFGDYSSQRINKTILSTGMLGLKCAENSLEYIWNFVNDDSFEAVKNKLSHGATQEGVNNDDLLYFPMLIPSIVTLRDYSVLAKDLYKQKYFNEIENERLTELRDFLLPMLMNGQVSVS